MSRMSANLVTYAAILAAFVAIDATWLVLVAGGLFQVHVGALLSDRPDWAAALAFYVIYAGGLLLLAVLPALKAHSLAEASVKGGILGLTAYATFDLTNLAILRGWSLELSLIDMTWGTVASSVAAAMGYAAGAWARKRSAEATSGPP